MEFTLAESGDCDFDGVLYKSEFSTQELIELGKSVTLYEEVEVFWIATAERPLPDADWMLKNFPSAPEIIRGICHGF